MEREEEENTEARGFSCRCAFRSKISLFSFNWEQKISESKSWFEQDGEFACFNMIDFKMKRISITLPSLFSSSKSFGDFMTNKRLVLAANIFCYGYIYLQ